MHDPDVVAFEIPRPWPKRVSWEYRSWYWPPLITVWHREPGGHDSGEICKWHTRYRAKDGTWKTRRRNRWKLHVWHWRLQVHPLQELRRWLLTRCEWCGGRHTRHDPVDTSWSSWDGPRGRWWQGEPGLYHGDCASVSIAHGTCLCEDPVTDYTLTHEGSYGHCYRCDRFRPWGLSAEALAIRRRLALVPAGEREPIDEGETK